MNAVSLFSGAMGLDFGLELAGFKVVCAVESDVACQKTIAQNKPLIQLFGDIRSVSSEDLRVPDLHLICGGPPCQSFSTVGNRLAFADARGTLVFEFLRVVQDLRPRFFAMENVKGLTSAASTDGENGDVLKIILEQMRSTLKYSIIHAVVDAVNYGSPQFRERLLILGSRDNEPIFIPQPTHFQRHQNPEYRWRSLRSAIQDVVPGACHQFSPSRRQWMEKIPPGGNWRNLSQADQMLALGGAYDNTRGGKTGFFRRLSFDEPCPTLVTSPLHKGTLLCHPLETRPLSISEYAAIQQFPTEWIFCGSLSDQYRQIGNAVPVGLGHAIGQMFASVVMGDSTIHTKRHSQPTAVRCYVVTANIVSEQQWTSGNQTLCVLPPALTFRDAVGDLPEQAGQSGETVAYATVPQNDFQRRMRGEATTVTEHYTSRHGHKMLGRLAYIPEGKGAHDPDVHATIPEHLRPGGFGNSYARISWHKPAPTITSNSGTPSSANCIHPTEPRALTIREAARCQSFPDTYRFIGTDGQKRLLIGNAVPPVLAEAVALALMMMLDGAAQRNTPTPTAQTVLKPNDHA